MQEFSSITASSYDAESLAPMLTEKTAEGWSVVSIVAAGTNVVAYLSRDTDASEVPSSDTAVESVAVEPDAAPAIDPADAPTQTFTPAPAPAPAEEPTGSDAADVSAAEDEGDVGTAVTGAAALSDLSTTETSAPDDDATVSTAPDTPAEPDPEPEPEPEPAADDSDASAEGAAASDAPADSGVPAGWYADPSGRYELRYWDGTAWTEHVSRAGQQYTDPPVA